MTGAEVAAHDAEAELLTALAKHVPEVADGQVVVKAVGRVKGWGSKVAVAATMPGVDAVGACIGERAERVRAVQQEMGGEIVQVLLWHESEEQMLAAALWPARLLGVKIDREAGKAVAYVPARECPKAIGAKGRNVRVAARLLGLRRLEIRPLERSPLVQRVAVPAGLAGAMAARGIVVRDMLRMHGSLRWGVIKASRGQMRLQVLKQVLDLLAAQAAGGELHPCELPLPAGWQPKDTQWLKHCLSGARRLGVAAVQVKKSLLRVQPREHIAELGDFLAFRWRLLHVAVHLLIALRNLGWESDYLRERFAYGVRVEVPGSGEVELAAAAALGSQLVCVAYADSEQDAGEGSPLTALREHLGAEDVAVLAVFEPVSAAVVEGWQVWGMADGVPALQRILQMGVGQP